VGGDYFRDVFYCPGSEPEAEDDGRRIKKDLMISMNEEDKKELIEEFKKGDGAKRLDLWDYALSQQVLWESIIAEMQKIAREQGVDKKLDEMMEEDLKNAEQ